MAVPPIILCKVKWLKLSVFCPCNVNNNVKRGINPLHIHYNCSKPLPSFPLQPLHVRYEMLVRAQRKAGLYEDALRTACDIVLVNKARLAIACENWQQVKQSVINHRGVKDRLVRR